MKPSRTSHSAFGRLALGLFSFFIAPCTLFISSAAAQDAPAQRTTVTGRVSDAVANVYLNNAEVRVADTNIMVYTGDDGTYSVNVPVGSVTITVSYANSRPGTRTIEAMPGQPNVLDFVLQPILAVPAATAGEDVIQLERFTVTDERVGQAKMIMEQRAADNVKTIISTDHFGDLTQGSVGEFMKYMPGITIDLDDEGEASYVRVGGLDPKYAGFSVDGVGMASATEGGTRANSFRQMSITSIESIEFNQTLLARMPANTPAGKFELKTRYAFNRKRPEWSFDLGFDGTGNTIELGRAYLPDNKKYMRTNLGGRIGYGGAFFKKRLGIEASVSHYQQYRNDQRHEIQYTYPVYGFTDDGTPLNPDTTFVMKNGRMEAKQGPTIARLSWLDGPRIITNQAASLSLDYKVTPNLTFALRSNYTYRENEYFNIYYRLLAQNRDDDLTVNVNAPPVGLDRTQSSLTRWVVNPSGPGGTQALESVLTEGASFRVDRTTNYMLSPRINYKKGPLEIDFRGAYSSSHARYSDASKGRFRGAPNRLGGLGWIAERSSPSSPEWTLTQTAGSLWTEPQNLSRSATYLFGIYADDPHFVKNTQASGFIDLTYAARVFNHPVTFRAGGGVLESEYTRRRNQKNYNYIGPEGLQMASSYPFADNYVFNVDLGGKSGNINDQNWPVINQNLLWTIFQENPNYFTIDAVDNTRNALMNRNDLTERIDAIYTEATTRAGRFQFNLGVRAERTSHEILFTRMLSDEEFDYAESIATPEERASGKFNRDGNGVVNTVEGVLLQYNYGNRELRKNSYDNIFLSGGMKYDFTKNLRLQLSFSQAILRPDYGNLSGTVQYPDYFPTNLWIPNPKLKPEKTTKYYAGLQYFINPGGIIEISAYRLDIKGLQVKDMQITPEQAEAQLGYSLDEALRGLAEDSGQIFDEESLEESIESYVRNIPPINYRSTINAEGTRTVYGVTFRYDQQLTFLPGFLKGLGLFGSFTTASLKNPERDEEKIGRASKSANGGIRYRYGRLNLRLSGNWTDDSLKYITRPHPGRRWVLDDYRYQKSRFTVDVSGRWRLNKNLELVLSVRNLTAEPIIWYSNVPGRICWYSVPDTIWNLSITGKY